MTNLTRHCSQFVLMLSTMLVNQLSLAADSDSALSPTTVTTGALFETLLGLLLVLSIIALLAWLLKRTNRFNTTASGQMQIIGGLSLGPRERAVLLQVGSQQILVGVTTQNVNTLLVLETPIEANNTDNKIPFSERLQEIMKKRESS